MRFSLLLLCLLASCTTPNTKDKSTKKVTVYSGRSAKLVQPLFEKFQKETGIEVEVKYAGSPELANLLVMEQDKSVADVFWSQDTASISVVESSGGLAELPTLPVIENAFVKNKYWVGVSGRARVLAYSTDRVKPEELPASVAELSGPRWKGKVGWAPPNGSFQAFVGAKSKLDGPEKTIAWLKAVFANDAKAYPKNTPAVKAIKNGEIDVALVNHYYLFRLAKEDGGLDKYPVRNHYFKNKKAESLVFNSAVGILKASKNPQASQKLIEFLLSKETQNYFVSEVGEFPAIRGVANPSGAPSVDELDAPPLDPGFASSSEQVMKLLKDAGVLE